MSLKTKWLSLKLLTGLLAIWVASCASVPETPLASTPRISPPAHYALSLQGTPYRFGKESPKEGFDCSGFVRHVYRRHGVLLPRTTHDMAKALPPIATRSVKSGDLVFFNVNGKGFSHVGIYVDDDNFIHAPSQRSGKVMVSSLKNAYWHKRLIGVRRPLQNCAPD